MSESAILSPQSKSRETSFRLETPTDVVRSLVHDIYRHIEQNGSIALPEGWHEYKQLTFSVTATQRHGKQQPVFFLHLRLPDGSEHRIVCKRDGKHMYEEQQRSETLQRLFPTIYFEVDDVAAIEPIRGLENERFRDFFMRHSRLIPALAKRSIELNDQLIDAGWYFVDISFARGHNVMLDDTGRLRLFDIHSIQHREGSRESAVLDFFERQFPAKNTHESKTLSTTDLYELQVYAEQVRAYITAHGEFPRVIQEKKTTLFLDHPRYQEAFNELSKTINPDEIDWIGERVTGEISIDPRIVDACMRGDLEHLQDCYRANDESIYTFVGATKRTLSLD